MSPSVAIDRSESTRLSPDIKPDELVDPRWQVAQRAVASHHFSRSRLLSDFLLYIVAETIADRQSEIAEHKIGVHVFGRPESYRSVEDNIVRTYARQLRRRLTEYFEGEGASEPFHIHIPLGGYVPVFSPASAGSPAHGHDGEVHAAAPTPASKQSQEQESQKGSSRRRLLLWLSFVAYSVILIGLTSFATGRLNLRHTAAREANSSQPLWKALFGGPANCYIVPADAGFNLLEDLLHRSLPLASYLNGSYLGVSLPQMDDHSANDLRQQRFTSFVDLQTVMALARLPEFDPQRVILRFPRELELDDLKDANAIILGSMGSNPWAMIAEKNANFRIVAGEAMQDSTIVNAHPQPGEAATYVSHWNQPAHDTYAVIAYLPNLSGNGHLLLLQGLDVAGTQAAAEMLIHPTAIDPILQRATRADGSVRSFEVLLRSSSIESRSAGGQIVGSRIY